MGKVTAAIVGSGNIGTDLLYKLLRSHVIEPRWMVGIDPDSEGLRRAARHGLEATAEGVDWLLAQDRAARARLRGDVRVRAPRQRRPLRATPASAPIDLTPAAVGPYVVPPVNLAEHLDAPNVNMITCGGQATIPIVHAVSRVAPVEYAEIVATVASRLGGPGHPREHRRVHAHDGRGVERLGGARRGKAIIILNPAEPPMHHARHDLLLGRRRRRRGRDHASPIDDDGRRGRRRTCPATGCAPQPQFDETPTGTPGQRLPRGGGRRATTCRRTPATSTS